VTERATRGVWIFPHSTEPATMAAIARPGQRAPDLRVAVLASRGDILTVQALARADRLAPGALVYVEQRGAFELLRREDWGGGRALLTLAAWPRR
jgi:hypothetical protein